MKYIIGSRDSLLARVQSEFVAKELTRLTGDEFTIKTCKTQGDLKLKDPLWKIPGKDFFTQELDVQLRDKDVDLVVHSYKDLSSTRPPEFTLAAVTKRVFAQDILLIRKERKQKLDSLSSLVIGTSSPRRIYQSTSLEELLPSFRGELKTKILRGNVLTRIEKLLSGQFDGIILAMAGLERLAQTEEGSSWLRKKFSLLDFMILPKKSFTPAPAQGALAIECLSNQTDLIKKINLIHHKETADNITIERSFFYRYGGGCHLALGVFSHTICGLRKTYLNGEVDKEIITQKHYQYDKVIEGSFDGPAFLGMPSQTTKENITYDEIYKKDIFPAKKQPANTNILCSSRYCIHALDKKNTGYLFSSGERTWRKIAQAGFWVHGSIEGEGESSLQKILNSALLPLFNPHYSASYLVLSHQDRKDDFSIACYNHRVEKPSQLFYDKIEKTKTFYWTSSNQFQAYVDLFPFIKNRQHFCGLGKTFEQLKQMIPITPCDGPRHFLSLTGNLNEKIK